MGYTGNTSLIESYTSCILIPDAAKANTSADDQNISVMCFRAEIQVSKLISNAQWITEQKNNPVIRQIINLLKDQELFQYKAMASDSKKLKTMLHH